MSWYEQTEEDYDKAISAWTSIADAFERRREEDPDYNPFED